MALVNAFDGGACIVELLFGPTSLFNQVMIKGQTSATFPGHNFAGTGETLQFSVDSSGEVELDLTAGSLTNGYEIHIEPQYPFGVNAQVKDIGLPGLYDNPAAVSGASQVNLTYSGGEGDVTPDPAVFSDAEDYIGLYLGANL